VRSEWKTIPDFDNAEKIQAKWRKAQAGQLRWTTNGKQTRHYSYHQRFVFERATGFSRYD